MNGQLRRVIGILGDRVRVGSPDGAGVGEELRLYVNGGGQLLALTAEQARHRQALDPSPVTTEPEQPSPGSTSSPAEPGDAPAAPDNPALEGYQQTS